ncbi:MAG: hypothetical protein BAJALOKI1v1_210015 [Promethearchaeota archaeon]|nr:MAG: hypothetical protein BAJALOKI1v1_210015 [Candidatus Lokiarchaeota archaeon]
MKISTNFEDIVIEGKTISLKERFTLILGDISLEQLGNEKINTLFRSFNDFHAIKLSQFLDVLQHINKDYSPLMHANAFLEHLISFKTIYNSDLQLLNYHITTLESFTSMLRYLSLKQKKERLSDELHISEVKYKSGKLSANRDLLAKLNRTIEQNEKELNTIKEPYYNLKNQRNQIIEMINQFQDTINKLNQEKKEKFSEINKHLRDNEPPSPKDKEEPLTVPEISDNIKVKNLRKEAKDLHTQIKEYSSKLKKKKEKLEKIEPQFQTYNKKFTSLTDQIDSAKEKRIEIEKNMEQFMHEKYHDLSTEFDTIHFNTVKAPETLKNELSNVENQLKTLKNSYNTLEKDPNKMISLIEKRIAELSAKVSDKKNNSYLSENREEILLSIEQFQKVELLLNNIEHLTNSLLSEINLKASLNIALSAEERVLWLSPIFKRNDREHIIFHELTTPEKVYYAMVFFLAFKIILTNNKVIKFSNLFLHQNFNKRGSIFRTLRKIIPILKNKKKLASAQFVFIISNLEMKKPIKNINIIQISK